MICNSSLGLVASLCESGLSLDELVVRTKDLFETKGMRGSVAFVLMLVDEELCKQLMQGTRAHEWCCKVARYTLAGREHRQIRTSVGKVELSWRRLRCTRWGKSFVPLRDLLGLARYGSMSSELEKMVAEIVSEQSYRRSSSYLDVIGKFPVPKSTAHRWVMQSECDELNIKGVVVESLFADGTGFKRKPDQSAGVTNRGELRVVLGIHKDGAVVPYGAWRGSTWEEIAQDIRAHTIKRGPLAKVLISDGEAGLAEGLYDLVKQQ